MLAACRREAPPPPGVIVPLDPQALSRALALQDAGATTAPPAPRPLRVELMPREPLADLSPLARALEARAAALDGLDPEASIVGDRVVLTFAVALSAWRTLITDQFVRRGVLELFVLDPGCEPFRRMVLPEGIEWAEEYLEGADLLVPFVRARADHGRGIAPLAPLQSLVASRDTLPGRRILIGTVRDRHGDVARRTWCVHTEGALRAPQIVDAQPTLHLRTLEPMLKLRFAPPDDARLQALQALAGVRPIVIAIDGEVIAARPAQPPSEDGWFEVVPQSRVGSVSPEIVAALLRSGPLPVDVQLATP
jgi:hypothetical protein